MYEAQNATPAPRPVGALPAPGGLLQRCAESRGPECWDELLARFGGKLAAGIGRALARSGRQHPTDLADDLRQEVLCRLLVDDAKVLRRCVGRTDREIGAYLFRVAESVAIDHLRRLAARKRGGAPDGEAAPVRLDAEACEAPCRRPGPERRLVLQQERRRFLALCRTVLGSGQPRRDLQIVYLALFEDCSSMEISRRSGGRVTVGAVDSLIHRVRRGLAARGLALPQRTRRRREVS